MEKIINLADHDIDELRSYITPPGEPPVRPLDAFDVSSNSSLLMTSVPHPPLLTQGWSRRSWRLSASFSASRSIGRPQSSCCLAPIWMTGCGHCCSAMLYRFLQRRALTGKWRWARRNRALKFCVLLFTETRRTWAAEHPVQDQSHQLRCRQRRRLDVQQASVLQEQPELHPPGCGAGQQSRQEPVHLGPGSRALRCNAPEQPRDSERHGSGQLSGLSSHARRLSFPSKSTRLSRYSHALSLSH